MVKLMWAFIISFLIYWMLATFQSSVMANELLHEDEKYITKTYEVKISVQEDKKDKNKLMWIFRMFRFITLGIK